MKASGPCGASSSVRVRGFALAIGEIEVVGELPALDVAAPAEERELVRLEELAQVAVRKEPRVPLVAGAFEPVDGERLEWICRRQLVDDEHSPAGPRHAGKLREDELGPRHVVQRPQGPGEVEGRIVEREPLGVAFDERRVRRRALSGELEQLRNPVDADDVRDVRRERKRKCAGAATHVETMLAPRRQHERAHTLSELRSTGVLPRGDLRRRAREPVLSHR